MSSVYKEQVLKVEPKGIEPIGADERHGKPSQIFSLWWSANVEFATLVTGALGVVAFGLSFWQTSLAIAVGSIIGALFIGALSTFGPRLGLPQLIQSRAAFGYYGNFLPGLFNFFAGFSWFAVNTVLGVYALEWLLHIGFGLALAIMVLLQVLVAIYGYNMIHTVERYMALVLTVLFLIVTYYAFHSGKLDIAFSAKTAGPLGFSGAFILMASIAFSYVLGWMAYASDYTRYLPSDTKPSRVFWNAAISVAVSCIWIEMIGAALATIKPVFVPTDLVTGLLPHGLGVLAMLAVVIGTITANALNIYSGSLSSLVLDIPMPRWLAAVVVGILGTIVAYIGGQNGYYAKFENFLFLLAYWIAPWLAVVFVDFFFVHRGQYREGSFYNKKKAIGVGFVAWVLGIVAAVPFFNQAVYTGSFAKSHPQFGDISFVVAFMVAAIVYAVFGRVRAST